MQKECEMAAGEVSGAEKNREIWPCARFIGLTGMRETRGHPSPGTGSSAALAAVHVTWG